MKVVKSYTDREIRIILEAIVEDTVRSHGLSKILKESDERSQIEITERGRETIKDALYAIASIITMDLPVIGWLLGPLLMFFTYTGKAPDKIIDLLEGKMGVDKFITAAENAAIKIATSANIPIVGNFLPDVGKLTSLLEPDSSRRSGERGTADKRLYDLLLKKPKVKGKQTAKDDIEAHISVLQARSGGSLTKEQAGAVIYAVDLMLDILTAAYFTRGKTIKKTKGRKKRNFKIPKGKEGFVSFGALPVPYNHLKGIAEDDPVETDAFNKVIDDDPDVEIVDDDFDDDGIIDVEAEEILSGDNRDVVTVSGVDYRQRTPELPYLDDEEDTGIPVDQQIRKQLGMDADDESTDPDMNQIRKRLGLDIDKDGYLFKIQPEWDEDPDDIDLDDFDLDDDDLEEARYIKNLREQIEVIKIINKVLR